MNEENVPGFGEVKVVDLGGGPKSNRKSISMAGNIIGMITEMSEGNIGGATVLMRIVKEGDTGIVNLLHLDDMNIRGSQVWVGYKNHCGEDLEKFIKCIESRDQEMVDTINKHFTPYEGDPNPPVAVKRGASFSR